MSLRPEQDNLVVAVHDRDNPDKWTSIDKWESYDVTHSVWDDCGQFNLKPTPTWDMFKLFKHAGQDVEIWCNGQPQMSGLVDTQDNGADASQGKYLTISGRDNCGLLVDSSAPRMGVVGLTFRQLLEKLLQPWYPERIEGITTNNAVNFYKMVGQRGRIYEMGPPEPGFPWPARQAAKAVGGSVIPGQVSLPGAPSTLPATYLPNKIEYRDATYWKVKGGVNSPQFVGTEEPHFKRIRGGEKVMDIIKDICKAVACFANMGPDRWFTVAKPRYKEQPYEKLVFKEKGNTNVKAVTRSSNISDRFAMYLAYGKGKKKRGSKGADNRHSYGAIDPSPAFWFGSWEAGQVQRIYKPCIIEARRGSQNAKMLRRLVRTKMEEAACKALTYEWEVIGHHDPGSGLLYAPDACIEVQDEVRGISGLHYIVTRRFYRNKDSGTRTVLRLIPAHIWLFDTESYNDADYHMWMSEGINW